MVWRAGGSILKSRQLAKVELRHGLCAHSSRRLTREKQDYMGYRLDRRFGGCVGGVRQENGGDAEQG